MKGNEVISDVFTAEEKKRFHNLLKLAAESPYEGERANALDAARRMAARHGMTLEEAATAPSQAAGREEPHRVNSSQDHEVLRRFAQAFHLMDYYTQMDKARLEAALKAARERGLDHEERRSVPREGRRSLSKRRMPPGRHAAVLLKETSLSFRDIADITGLDVYEVVGMKLKMRAA